MKLVLSAAHMPDSLFALQQQLANIVAGDRIRNAARIAERGLLFTLYKYHIDHAIYKSGFGIVERASAAAWIGGAIKLKYRIGGLLQLADHFCIELPRVVRGQNNGRN